MHFLLGGTGLGLQLKSTMPAWMRRLESNRSLSAPIGTENIKKGNQWGSTSA
ncbi:hypothetical protein [Archangium lansingense]|uniref:Uncharacterized protein n=1 Tax=Archangium lansingense TaxID=2995310 RepID=A0ABT4A5S0_9BACT|nr:hypothetical protein [Archangium lansinium]MCY1076359.1 hypothetical protein [Archangium lansinium]